MNNVTLQYRCKLHQPCLSGHRQKTLSSLLHLSQFGIYALLTVSLVVLAGCQNQPVLHAYDGEPKAAEAIATFIIPRDFELLYVDGEAYTHSILVDGLTVNVLPGTHEFVLKYIDYWDIDADNHERVESQPLLLSFNTAAGNTYHIKFKELNDIQQARAFAEKPSVDIIEAITQKTVATEVRYRLSDESVVSSFRKAKSPKNIQSSMDSKRSDAKNTQAFEMLKYWWQQAEPTEQEDFLQWLKK